MTARARGRSVPGCGAQMQVRALGETRPARIHDHEPGALLLRLLDVRDEMDPGNGRVDAPEHDEARVRVVRIRDSGHLAVESGIGRGRRRGADRARQPRRAEPPEEPRIRRALREIAVRAAVGERQDRLPPAAAPNLEELLRNVREGFVPRDGPETSFALRPVSKAGLEQPRLAVHVARELAHLGADVAVGDRIDVRSADRHDPALGDRDVETAGVRTVERAGARDVGLGRPGPGAHPFQSRMRSMVSTAMGWYPGRAFR